MATYTNTETFERDFAIPSSGQLFNRLITRSAVIAYNYINARLAGVYAVPFVTSPPLIIDISDILTRCVVMKLQMGKAPVAPKPPKDRAPKDDCEFAILMLDDLVKGTVTLPGVPMLSGALAVHTRDGYTPIFDVDSSLNHQPDFDLIDHIESERDP